MRTGAADSSTAAGPSRTWTRSWAARWPRGWADRTALRTTDLRPVLLVLADCTPAESLHRGAEYHAEVRRVVNADRAAAVGQLHAAQGRRRGCRGQAQGAAGQGSRDSRERRARPVPGAAWPHRRVHAPDPPAGPRVGPPSFPDGSSPAQLRLTNSVTTTTGVVIATYQPADAEGPPSTG